MILKNGKRIDGCSDTVPIGTLNPFLGTTAPYGYLLCQGQLVSKTTYKELYQICGDMFGQSTDTEFYLPDLRGQTIAGYKEVDPVFGALAAIIGTTSSKFTPKGTNSGTAVILNGVNLSHSGGSVQSHTLTIAEIPSHNHGLKEPFYKFAELNQGLVGQVYKGDKHQDNTWYSEKTGGGQGHSHGFTQPSAHSFTPTTKSITQPTFTGQESSISTIQPTVVLNWIVKAFQLMPNQSYVSNLESNSKENTYSCDFINTLISEVKNQVLDSAFPVGKIEVFFDNEDHSNYLGFTWERELEGETPVGYKESDSDYNKIGKALGAKAHSVNYTPAGANTGGAVQSHTLTINEMPSHSHGVTNNHGDFGMADGAYGVISNIDGSGANVSVTINNTGGSGAHNHGFTQPIFTGKQATITMDTRDPQKVVAYWRRVA